MVAKLSPSTLSLLEDCPKCFWLQIVKKISRPSGAFPSLPSGMDKKLKEHFDRFMAKGELPPELIRHGLSGFKLFDDVELLKGWRSNFKGIQYTDPSSGIILHGAVDNILIKNDSDRLIVLDYKTRGFPLKDDTAHHYQDQMNFYTFLLQQNGYKTEDFAYLLFYIPDRILETGEVVFATELVKLPVHVEHAKALFEAAVKVVQGPMPGPGNDCTYCGWKRMP